MSVTALPGPESRPSVCENCAHVDAELLAVRRVYLTPESWDTPAAAVVLEEVERWCLSCVSQYPCRPADP